MYMMSMINKMAIEMMAFSTIFCRHLMKKKFLALPQEKKNFLALPEKEKNFLALPEKKKNFLARPKKDSPPRYSNGPPLICGPNSFVALHSR